MSDPFKSKSFLKFHKKILIANSLFISAIHNPDSSPYPSWLRYVTICVNTLKVSISRMYL